MVQNGGGKRAGGTGHLHIRKIRGTKELGLYSRRGKRRKMKDKDHPEHVSK